MRPIDTGSFQWEVVKQRMNARIEDHKTLLVGLTDPIMIHRTQGRIQELQAFMDEVEDNPS